MQTPTLRWPIDLRHGKCDSSEHVYPEEISVEATGHLIFKCNCWRCEEDFVIKLSMLQLTAEAVIADKETLGEIAKLPGTWTAYSQPN